MKITHIEAIILQSPQSYGIHANEAAGPQFRSLLRVETDAGITGWSEIETQPHVLKAVIDAPGDGTGFFDGLGCLAVGENPLEPQHLWDKLFTRTFYYGRRGVVLQAISGIDIACHDIIGKALGKPVYALLGERCRDRVPAYASTLFRDTPQAMRDAAQRYIERGFTAVKFGWGDFGRNLCHDLSRVEAARETLGPRRALMIDCGWVLPRTVDETIAMIRALEPFVPYWVEEPCHPEDYAAYRAVVQAASIPIAAGEQEGTLWGFQRLIHEAGVDVVQPDLSRCGGFTVATQVIPLAAQAGRSICPHAWQSDLLTAASLHLNAVLPEASFQEYSVCADPLSRSLCRKPLSCENGWLHVPEEPGLGVLVDEEVLARYRLG